MDKRGGGRGVTEYQDFPSKLCLTVPKNFVGEPFCAAFQKISGSQKFMDKRGGGEYQGFPSKVFRLMLPKNFVGEPFSVSLFSGVEKFCASEGYSTIFRRIFCCLTVPKVSVGESFSLSII